jgi:serine/threonine-protein kinase
MATVYRARDKRLGREVAVKIIHRHLRENKEVGQRFASEARAVAKVKHPGVVEVYDVSDDESDERYLVVELVRGKTLRQLLNEEGHLPPEIAAAIGIELALALDHAHGLGVIHRDVKPENVLLRTVPEGRTTGEPEKLVKITDFGIAKLLDAQGVTSTGQVLGSPAHMAPEQIEGGEVSARSDVFGLGVLLYECLVGKLPFDGKNPAQVLRRVLEGAFTPAERARPTVGSELGSVVDHALAKDAPNRFASALEVAEALREKLRNLGFEDPAGEIGAFLQDPRQYRASYEQRVVEQLVLRGRSAREAGDVPTATASFNRALAFRPDDADLIAQVSSLARNERRRRALLKLGGAVFGSLVLVLGVVGLYKLGSRLRGAEASPKATVAPLASEQRSVASTPLTASAGESAAPAQTAAPRPRRPSKAQAAEPKASAEANVRVRVLVVGPQNATVLVDGEPLVNWFGVAHDLPAGDHAFEFRPPNAECCFAPPAKTVTIRTPENGGEQVVQGVIGWKPATLEFRGPPLSSATCGEVATFPSSSGSVVINMQKPSQRVPCTMILAKGSGEEPKPFDVELFAGRTSSFPRP